MFKRVRAEDYLRIKIPLKQVAVTLRKTTLFKSSDGETLRRLAHKQSNEISAGVPVFIGEFLRKES